MAKLSKSDLQYDDYSWKAYRGDDPKVTGKPDSTLFNRKEGYEVLYLINKMIENEGYNKIKVLGIEKLIHEDLPGSIRSQEKVYSWIKEQAKKAA